MSPFKYLFSDFKEFDDGRVLLDDDQEWKVKGLGSFKLFLLDGIIRSLNEIRFVPELGRSLISLGSLDAFGFRLRYIIE